MMKALARNRNQNDGSDDMRVLPNRARDLRAALANGGAEG
jgi:hypothetical protein